eukprot:Opistho-1_new@60221
MAAPSVGQLYADLSRKLALDDPDHAGVVSLAERILTLTPDDETALRCKAIALIHSGRFEDAVTFINGTPSLASALQFELAYAHYRLYQPKEALAIIARHPDRQETKFRELAAQSLYRLEDYASCVEHYTRLEADEKDDTRERATNLLAAATNALFADSRWGVTHQDPQERDDESTYELCFNAASLAIARGDLRRALRKLAKAEALCRESLATEGLDQEEIEGELAAVKIQQAVVSQLEGSAKAEDVLESYNAALRGRPDAALAAVAANNIIVLNGERDVFDSKKKIKIATAEGLERKLTGPQRRVIAFNRCIALAHMNQMDQSRQAITEAQSAYPDSDVPALALASLHLKRKDTAKAIEVLQAHATQRGDAAEGVHLALAQHQLAAGNVKGALSTLAGIPGLKHRLGVVAAVVQLAEKTGDLAEATRALDQAVDYWSKSSGPSSAPVVTLLQESAAFHLRHGAHQKAAAAFERILKANPKDSRAVAGIIRAYSAFDPKMAEQYSSALPEIRALSADETDMLENLSAAGRVQRKGKGAEDAKAAPEGDKKTVASVGGGEGFKSKAKKKKKRRGKLPKNYDPNIPPDPERWLPRRERSNYKKTKRQKKDNMKGTQGAAEPIPQAKGKGPATAATTAPAPSAGASAGTAAPQAAKTAQAPAPKQSQSQKKKKKGSKW